MVHFTPSQESMYPADVKINEIPGAAGSSTTSTADTGIYGWLMCFQIPEEPFIIMVEINRPVGLQTISEFFQGLF